MSSEDMNGLSSQLVFSDEAMPFNCANTPQRRVGDPGPKTRELCGFMDDKLFPVDRDRFFAHQGADFRRSVFSDSRNWNGSARSGSGKGSEEEDDDDDDDDEENEVDDGDDDVEGLVSMDDVNKCNKMANPNSSNSDRNDQSSGGLKNGTNKLGNGKPKHHSSFGGTLLVKDGMVGPSASNAGATQSENHPQARLGNYPNAVTIAEPDGDAYYSQYLQGTEGSASGQKDLGMENGCGFNGRRDASISSEPGESLRTILADPVTGALMDDAMILPCGHSFGSGGIQHVLRVKSCYSCSQSVSEDSIAQNLSLQAAVQAFRREEEILFYRSPKRRRERFEQDKGGYGDLTLMDTPRGRGVQFPFVVTDRVIIKGNKRTPQRFVGREAVVTTQCLNGWYVVKTLDNAESVKLQYRSLAKVPNDAASKPIPRKIAPNWL
ncbi:U-box domain-containing protein 62 isoform X2 [Momordica charantia]|uniref:U-box domain-containing protein 62 isoform X2 n=1 Tax=Momordica charantia TaxID=3673 RepID=A0A6J1CYI7_MOMCH|nr:U-box domain-containing protein 62 isoform X2 [Momordica charantia]